MSTDTPVYLYGAASIGKIVYLRNPSLNICGFLDKRAGEIKNFMGLPVYTLAQATASVDKQAVIMLSIKNVFELEDIAVSLYEAGFDKLIYKSRAVLEGHGNAEDEQLSRAWDALVEGSFTPGMEKFPCFQDAVHLDFTDHSLIASMNGEILSYVPVELIYTNQRNDKWSDLNIQGYYPHIYFFYYLSNHKNGQIQDYIKFAEETAREQGDIKITDAWRKNVLRNRTDVYEHMKSMLDMDPLFFRRNAPTVLWNEKGYFNLTSGKHRCAFLVSQGYRYIAVKMKESDHRKFLSYGNPEDIQEEIVKGKRRYLNKKSYHPWFYHYPCAEPAYYSYFQVEALSRSVRLAHEYRRKILLYTNLQKTNSLLELLDRCRMVQRTDAAAADVLLLDETSSSAKRAAEQCALNSRLWWIGPVIRGTVMAEYFSKEGAVYFCESIKSEEEV